MLYVCEIQGAWNVISIKVLRFSIIQDKMLDARGHWGLLDELKLAYTINEKCMW